ncbi:efflux RND transporter periplasmic adaptor subunit [Jiella sonneratiae]|uniref:efflux RND transporter periplasmic adaptor subunit n=1 Tax=Jiella sonneratiae TaxID=2816856 RepID=UPI00315ABB21
MSVAAATAGSLPITFDTIGSIVPVASATLNSQVIGIVAEIAVADGARVKKGDLLVRLDDRAAQAVVAKDRAAWERDQATLQNARASSDRIQRLVKSGADTKQQGDDALAAVRQAEATIGVDEAAIAADEVTLSNTRITAPFDGRLGALQVSVGALVQPGTAIVTLNQLRPVYAQFTLPEATLAAARQTFARGDLFADVTPTAGVADSAGARVAANVAARPAGEGALVASADADPTGKVTFLDNAVDQVSASFKLRATFPNDDEALLPGQFLTVRVHFGSRDGLVLVPGVAVEPRDEGSIVYVVGEDGTVDVRKVTVALRAGDVAGISDGLKPGEKVVTEGQLNLARGMRVVVAGDKAKGGGDTPRQKGAGHAGHAGGGAAS